MKGKGKAEFHQGFEFDFMAQQPMYAVCPRWLLEHCKVDEHSTVVDLGCGSGIFTQFLLDRFPDAPDLRVIAIEPSEFELDIMKSRIVDNRVTFVQGRAQEAAEVVPPVDAAILCNILHQIPLVERRPIFEAVFGLLKPGGALGANTLFYDGGIPADTRDFYTLWMVHARNFLKKRSIALEPPTELPIALQRLSPEQHHELLTDTGFVDLQVEEVDCKWTTDDWAALSKYSVFIRGALAPDIDLSIGSQALIEGVRASYQDLGIDTINRGWLHCAARRP
jgi:tRNA (cmo5U34)-methyltransferase